MTVFFFWTALVCVVTRSMPLSIVAPRQDRKALRTGFAIAFSLHGAARPSGDRHHSANPSITAWLVAARAEPAEEASGLLKNDLFDLCVQSVHPHYD